MSHDSDADAFVPAGAFTGDTGAAASLGPTSSASAQARAGGAAGGPGNGGAATLQDLMEELTQVRCVAVQRPRVEGVS
jgi:hypothetical protein